jgi:hypothetical protein
MACVQIATKEIIRRYTIRNTRTSEIGGVSGGVLPFPVPDH